MLARDLGCTNLTFEQEFRIWGHSLNEERMSWRCDVTFSCLEVESVFFILKYIIPVEREKNLGLDDWVPFKGKQY